ncbi:hypothetical protein A3742_18230 [Oleiphilus sp. HI0071]|jgi:hypothetical protein|nr:hypothetical protein A3737_13920 [Oleiphilus sp. HI0065]KZY79187.1 hypothetical protein A3742_14765 [Oleiphilus sp. HI0071]KZY89465.1 hypothetical protein A3744_23365 [Oleiphilus sp. HI0073]KZZ09953.1 hypothetical protein A3750_08315 [Oleiphilus sp. HI0079]KZZ16766.1 hypothetical protein A3751_13800 [Oleiphilus sp. HI0080]KZZ43725.1 hypothetical protein A3758_03795 [Oleiphilus sp. HI0118]KZZ48502.1 hypothetical protein A3760_23505 [Oleiphilus sp. HI0122]KZZ72119.1 hypothetical protein A37
MPRKFSEGMEKSREKRSKARDKTFLSQTLTQSLHFATMVFAAIIYTQTIDSLMEYRLFAL